MAGVTVWARLNICWRVWLLQGILGIPTLFQIDLLLPVPCTVRTAGKLLAAVAVQGACEIVYVHDDAIKWKHFPRHWPFVRGIHRSAVNPPHKGQWRGALMFSLMRAWTDGWANHRDAGDLRHHRAHYAVTLMLRLWRTENVVLASTPYVGAGKCTNSSWLSAVFHVYVKLWFTWLSNVRSSSTIWGARVWEEVS